MLSTVVMMRLPPGDPVASTTFPSRNRSVGAIDESGAFPREVIAGAAKLGLMGVTIPAEQGGAGRDYVSYALAIEALATASAVVAVIAAVNNSLVAEPLAELGEDAQRERWLRPLASGEAIGAFALSEEHAGSDVPQRAQRAGIDGQSHAADQ